MRYELPDLYRARNLVERFFNRIKPCRRLATRYDKLAADYLAFVQLASIRLWLCVNESTSQPNTNSQNALIIATASTACARKPTVKASVRNTGRPSV